MYAANKPYPNINVKRRNTDHAKLLLHDYAGINGEDTAIHQYFYQLKHHNYVFFSNLPYLLT